MGLGARRPQAAVTLHRDHGRHRRTGIRRHHPSAAPAGRAHRELTGLAGINFLYQLAHCVLPSMYVLYTSYRYGWSARTVGLTLMGVGVLSILVQGLLVKPAIARLGERGAIYVGLLFGIAGFSGFALAPSAIWMWASLPIFALWGLVSPGLQGLMSERVAANERGKLQGANGSITSIAGLIGPTVFTQSFAYFIDPSRTWILPGAPFYVAAALLAAALPLAVRVPRRAPAMVEPRQAA